MSQLTNKKFQLLLFLSFIGLYLRFSGIGHVPLHSFDPRETFYILKIISPLKSLFQLHSAHPSPLFLIINSFTVFLTSGSFDSGVLLNRLDMEPASIYLPLKYLSVFFGAGSIIIIYFIGSFFGTLCAILASGFLSVSLLHVQFSELVLPYSGMTFFLLLSLYFALKFLLENNRENLRFSFLFALLSALMHISGLLSIVPLLFALALKNDFKRLKITLGSFLFWSLILNLFTLLDLIFLLPEMFRSYIEGYFNYRSSSFFLYPFIYLWHGVGPVVWLSAIYLLFSLKSFDTAKVKILFSVPFAYIPFITLFHVTGLGYAVLFVPFFCIASSMVFSDFTRDTNEKTFAFIVLILFALWIPFKYSAKYNKLMSLPDTKTIATDWVKENISNKMKISWDKNSLQLNWQDAYDKRELKNLLGEAEIVVNRKNFSIDPDLLKKNNWFKSLRKKADYLIISAFDYELELRQPGKALKKKYYSKLLKRRPYIVFNPYLKDYDKKTRSLLPEELYSPFLTLWQRERSGPLIKVYKI